MFQNFFENSNWKQKLFWLTSQLWSLSEGGFKLKSSEELYGKCLRTRTIHNLVHGEWIILSNSSLRPRTRSWLCFPSVTMFLLLLRDKITLTKIYQKEVYFRLGIWHLLLIFKIKTRWQLPGMVSHHHQDGHPPSQGWTSTIQNFKS